jgi:hypothetical protein
VDATGIPEPAGWEDPLTGLEGPDFWRRVLVAEVARSARYRRSLTVVIIELEGVAELGEIWGMNVARRAVREAAQCIRRVLTETDEIAAINFVERVRDAGPRSMPRGFDGMRFSFGWASPKQGESADGVVKRADQRLAAEILA